MKAEFEDIPILRNEILSRFEMSVDHHLGFINYDESGDKVVSLMHTEVAPVLSGTGAAAALVEKTLVYLEGEGILVQPFCPYIFAFIKKHPEWKRIVPKSFESIHKL